MTRPGGTVITPAVLREWPLPGVEGGKESRGRAVVVGGSVQNPGALILAAEASLRAGAGKSQVVAPDPVAVPIGVAMPEALVQGGPVAGSGDLAPGASGFVAELCPEAEAVLIGPGLLDPAGAADLVAACVPHVSTVLVLDALGLAWVTPDPSRVRDFAGRCVLSPNLAELALVLGEDADAVEADQAGATLRLAAATGAVVTSGGTTHCAGRANRTPPSWPRRASRSGTRCCPPRPTRRSHASARTTASTRCGVSARGWRAAPRGWAPDPALRATAAARPAGCWGVRPRSSGRRSSATARGVGRTPTRG